MVWSHWQLSDARRTQAAHLAEPLGIHQPSEAPSRSEETGLDPGRAGGDGRVAVERGRDPRLGSRCSSSSRTRSRCFEPLTVASRRTYAAVRLGWLRHSRAPVGSLWAHRHIGHEGGDRDRQMFVELDDMYDTLDYTNYNDADLARWALDETDAPLNGWTSPGHTDVWRGPGRPPR